MVTLLEVDRKDVELELAHTHLNEAFAPSFPDRAHLFPDDLAVGGKRLLQLEGVYGRLLNHHLLVLAVIHEL